MPENTEQQNSSTEQAEVTQAQIDNYSDYTSVSDKEIKTLLSQ
jgi:hypothetical protein